VRVIELSPDRITSDDIDIDVLQVAIRDRGEQARFNNSEATRYSPTRLSQSLSSGVWARRENWQTASDLAKVN
jgi:hypothetical protein